MATGIAKREQARAVGIDRKYRVGVLAWLHLMRVHSRIAYEEYTLLAEYGLTPAQFDVLSHLVREDGLSQQEVADRLLVTKGNVCGLVDRLESARLVERSRNPADRRSNQLHITLSGAEAFDAAAPALEETICGQLSELSDEEQALLMNLLARLDRSLRDS